MATCPQLDVAALDQLLDAVGHRRVLTDERLAVAHQFAQLTDLRRRDETGSEQPVAQEVGEPLAVTHVGLPAGHGLGVAGVDEDDREHGFEMLKIGLQ